MPPHALIPRKELLLIALLVFPCLSPAQQGSNFPEVYAQADAQLNNDYKRSFGTLAAPTQEAIRRAERAWVNFADKDKTLVNTLQNENLLPQEFAHAHIVVEMRTRSEHLETFFISNTVPTSAQYILKKFDQNLTNSYADCMRRLSESDQNLLRESERAWIAYRDADAVAMKLAYTSSNQPICYAALVHLTAMRTAQLKSIVQSVTPAAITNSTTPQLPSIPVQNSSPNPEDVKAVSQFQDDAKAVLNSLLKNKDSPFFKKADSIKNIPDLPLEITDKISKLNDTCTELSQKWDSAKLLAPASNECAAVKLLAAWSKFTQQLKTGSVDDAGSTLQNAVDLKPKDVAGDYLPIWQNAESWNDVFVKDEAKFHEHLQKAKSAADMGKTSEAIKEYQAAYEIIENSSIPQQIKKLRDQSLGL